MLPNQPNLRYTRLTSRSCRMFRCATCGTRMTGPLRYCSECGAPQFMVSTPQVAALGRHSPVRMATLPAVCGPRPHKRVGVSILLAALFGPLGLLYSSVSGALYMSLAWCFLVLATCEDWIANNVVPMLIVWPVCVVWAVVATKSHNEDRR